MSQTIVLPGIGAAPVGPTVAPATLTEIERATAERIGPYALLTVESATGADVIVNVLKSTITLGGYDDLYVLRRSAGLPQDRQCRVKTYDPALGQLSLDRTYDDPPMTGALLELHHLDPVVLRRVVRAALARCWLQFRLDLLAEDPLDPGAPFVPQTGSVDLTAYVAPPLGAGSWLIEPGQVLDVIDPAAGDASIPGARLWGHAGHVWLALPDGTSTPGKAVVCRRSHFGWVNRVNTPEGPNQDADVLECALDYAAGMAHIEAWRTCRPQLEAVAAEGRQATQAEAAAEATRLAVAHAPWLFVPGGPGGRSDRRGPLLGLPGATAYPSANSLGGAVIN